MRDRLACCLERRTQRRAPARGWCAGCRRVVHVLDERPARGRRRRARAPRAPTARGRTATSASRISGRVAERVPRAVELGRVAEHALALAVVAAAARLEDGGEPEVVDRAVEVVAVVDRRERRDAMPEALERLLLGEAVLGDLERRGSGRTGCGRGLACARRRRARPPTRR